MILSMTSACGGSVRRLQRQIQKQFSGREDAYALICCQCKQVLIAGDDDFRLRGNSTGKNRIIIRVGNYHWFDRFGFDHGRQDAVPYDQFLYGHIRVRKACRKLLTAQSLSEFLCQPSRARYLLVISGTRSSNKMAKWFNASFQWRTGIVHRCDASRIAM